MTKTTIVNTSRLISTASTFQTRYSQVNNMTQNILNMVNRFSGVWESDASRVYVNKIRALDNDIGQIRAKINEHISDLQSIASEYNSADSAVLSKAASLKGDYIP